MANKPKIKEADVETNKNATTLTAELYTEIARAIALADILAKSQVPLDEGNVQATGQEISDRLGKAMEKFEQLLELARSQTAKLRAQAVIH